MVFKKKGMAMKSAAEKKDKQHYKAGKPAPAPAASAPPPLQIPQAAALSTRGAARVWPINKALPEYHEKRIPPPCPKCRVQYLSGGGQAAVCTSVGREVAWYRCKNRECGHRWALPIKTE